MTDARASKRLMVMYDVLKGAHEKGQVLQKGATEAFLKELLTSAYIAQENEEDLELCRRELDLAQRLLAGHKPPANPQGNVLRMPCRPRVVASPPDGGDAA